jgi:superfamily II DNA/RNA helicase
MLTIHEAIVCDENLDADGRDRSLNEARQLIREMHKLPSNAFGSAETERLLADARIQLLRKLSEGMPEDESDGESAAAGDEDTAAALVSVAIPAERRRIQELLAMLPQMAESKTNEVLRGIGDLWAVHPHEKLVIFTTYLGSVDTLRAAIEGRFQGVGVEVLKGGDHGAKLAAERRFKRPDGPRVLICTAAGREGINLQFARVLFNHDLPWNPMDVEQRIGRIHRYGQVHTAQVYNLVSADTIEGKIYLLLEEKLREIGRALGKVDERGRITEDLREQVLGQLSERLSYDKLYQDAVRDPTLRRSRQELEVALENARTARQVVSELFQDLEGFRLDDYKQFDDGGKGMERLFRFVQEGIKANNGTVKVKDAATYEATLDGVQVRFTTERDRSKLDDNLTLLGIEHPLARDLMKSEREFPAKGRSVAGRIISDKKIRGALSIWRVQIHGGKGQYHQRIVTIGLNEQRERSRQIERLVDSLRELAPAHDGVFRSDERVELVRSIIPDMLRRELTHNGLLASADSLSCRLMAWVELV